MLRRQQAFGYTQEDVNAAARAHGARGRGAARLDGHRHAARGAVRAAAAALRLLQAALRAGHQPAARRDPRRARDVDGIDGRARAQPAVPEPESCRQINVRYPIIDNDQLAKLRHIRITAQLEGFRSVTLPMIYDPREGGAALERAMDRLQAQASAAVRDGNTILILSDRGVTEKCAPIPSLLATAGVHHHLVREGTRTRCALVLESGDAREVHHVALLIGYGAGAVNPYLAFETLDDMIRQGHGRRRLTHEKATRQLHQGAQQGHPQGDVQDGHLDAAELLRRADLRGHRPRAGVRRPVLHLDGRRASAASASTSSPSEVQQRHARAFPSRRRGRRPTSTSGGEYQWRRDGELHLFNPETVHKLQHATRSGQYSVYREYTDARERPEPRARHAARPARLQGAAHADAARRGRAGRGASSSASPPARCRTARSARKRTRRSPSR